MRAISTVLDASLCLLLVSASAITLAGTPTSDSSVGLGTADEDHVGPDTADQTAELLARSTARVTYEAADNSTKISHDTLAGLFSSAAHADARGRSSDFVLAVAAKVNHTLRRHASADVGVQVVARRAERAEHSAGGNRITAGEFPPPTTDVHAARLRLRGTQLTVRTWSA